MAIISLLSVSGAPGVTTTALAATSRWPRPVIYVEADTSKTSSILPGMMRAAYPYSRGLSTLSLEFLRGELTPRSIIDSAYTLGEQYRYVAGFDSATAAAGTTTLWGALANVLDAFASANTDVVLDLGRYGVNDPRLPLIQASDSVLLTMRPTLPDIYAAKDRVSGLLESLQPVGHSDHLELLLVGDTGEQYGSGEISGLLGLSVDGWIANEPDSAEVFSRGKQARPKFERSKFDRSIAATVETITQNIRRRHERLGLDPNGQQGANA